MRGEAVQGCILCAYACGVPFHTIEGSNTRVLNSSDFKVACF